MDNYFILYVVLSIVGGFIYAEFIGYFLHMLLHSNKIKYLSKSHMIHHLRLYGPKMPQRSEQYKISVSKRWKLSGIGMEWILPIAIILGVSFLLGWLLKIPLIFQGIILGVAIIWGSVLFAYMHNAMHIKGFWMTKNRLLKKWFVLTRHRHDIHHIELSNDGRMNKNYGICFFFFDRLFGSFKAQFDQFNKKGFEAAEKRYHYIFKLKV